MGEDRLEYPGAELGDWERLPDDAVKDVDERSFELVQVSENVCGLAVAGRFLAIDIHPVLERFVKLVPVKFS